MGDLRTLNKLSRFANRGLLPFVASRPLGHLEASSLLLGLHQLLLVHNLYIVGARLGPPEVQRVGPLVLIVYLYYDRATFLFLSLGPYRCSRHSPI